jgi:hypothetical protein
MSVLLRPRNGFEPNMGANTWGPAGLSGERVDAKAASIGATLADLAASTPPDKPVPFDSTAQWTAPPSWRSRNARAAQVKVTP